jgi:outer membrane protein
MKNKLLSTAVIFIGYLGISSIGYGEDLKSALSTAYINNPTLEANRAAQRALDETVNQAKSGWRPTISATGSYTRNNTTTGNPFAPQGTRNPKAASISLDQPIFRGFQTVNGTKEARKQVEAGQAQLLSTEQQIFLATVQAYSDVIRDEAVLDLTKNNVLVLRRQLQASEDRFEVGEITRTDVAQSKARLSRSISENILSEANLTASRAAYQRIVGNEPGTLERDILLPTLPASEEAAFEIAFDKNPVLVAAKASEEAATYGVKKQYGGLAPSVTVSASYSRGWDSFRVGDRTTSKEIMARLNVPIYQAGVQASNVRQAKQRRSQFRMEAIAADREVREQVRNALEGYREASARIESTLSQLEANEIALEGVRQEADVGSRTILDVLDAEQELLDARVNNARAVRDRTVAAYNLLLSTGQLNAADLGLEVAIYDAKQRSEDTEDKIYGFGVE